MMYGTREQFEYLECAECGSIQIDNIPQDLGKYYPSDYYSLQANNNLEDVHFLRSFFRSQRSNYMMGKISPIGWTLNKNAPDYFPYPWFWFRNTSCSSDSPILDVGCGHGKLLATMREHGFRRLEGVDPFINQQISFPGLTIHRKPLLQIAGSYQLVMSHHSLEHMPDPLRYLDKMKSLCRKNGYLLIRMPVLNASWSIYGRDWVELDVPRHLWIPTIGGLKKLIKKVGGLSIESISFDSDSFEIYQSELYSKNIPIYDESGKKTDPSMIFSEEELDAFQRTAKDYNKTGKAGRIVLIIKNIKGGGDKHE